LGANIFRITQTEAKIKRENIRGQGPLEAAAREVGRNVRQAIQDMGGTMPENLPPSENITHMSWFQNRLFCHQLLRPEKNQPCEHFPKPEVLGKPRVFKKSDKKPVEKKP
jgi:hypothetical protein